MSNYSNTDRVVIDKDVLPIFIVEKTDPIKIVSFEGTGFLMGKNLFITCWHCVASTLPPTQYYAAFVKNHNGEYEAPSLENIQQDSQGSDLATANINLGPSIQFKLPDGDAPYGTNVWSFGYPLTDRWRRPDKTMTFQLNGRFLEGYVMRSFYYEHIRFGRTPSYELDMPTPAGLSGAPLVRTGSQDVIGVIYGSNDVATIEQMAQINTDTGKREPEIHRIISFGLAHYTETLRKLSGAATKGLPLYEFLQL